MHKSASLWISCSEHDSPKELKQLGPVPNVLPRIHIDLGTIDISFDKTLENVIDEVKRFSARIPYDSIRLESRGDIKVKDKRIVLDVKKNQQLENALKEICNHFNLPEAPILVVLAQGDGVSKLLSLIQKSGLKEFKFKFNCLEVTTSSCCNHCDNSIIVGRSPFQSPFFFRSSHFINGRWSRSIDSDNIPVYNPSNGSIFHTVASGTPHDIEIAVASAQKAFPLWSSMEPTERALYLNKIADIVESRIEDIARIEVLDNGKPLREAKADIGDVVACFRYYANLAIDFFKKQGETVDVQDESVESKVFYESVGVAGLIVPWNYPLLMAVWKVAPCLASGSTCVLKPSELTPLSALELGAIAHEAGLPQGVLNIVIGYGPIVGDALSTHPNIQKLAFTGSVKTGSVVMSKASCGVTNVTLELGGKSPIIVCKDADIEQAVEWILLGIFFNGGQVCSATSRLIVHKDIEEKLLNRLKEEANKIVIGDGFDPNTLLGPLVSKEQWKKVLQYIEKGKREGAKLFCGGGVPSNLSKGYFVQPTIFRKVKSHMTIWNEEIFGPVLCCMSFETEAEALNLANDSYYGLAGAVISQDKDTCLRIARALRVGIVWTNCSQPTYCQAPWGGMKRSGMGRELGPWGLMNYLEVKQVTSWVDPKSKGWNWYQSRL